MAESQLDSNRVKAGIAPRLNLGRLLRWRLHIGTYFKIPLFIHWSFFILPGIIGYQAYRDNGQRWDFSALMVLSVLICFTCVILHEYGHSLAARAFGIGTRDITMMPIGGVARLEKMPRDPWQEIIVAVAGPAVNVVIALALAISVRIVYGPSFGFGDGEMHIAPVIMLINLGLVIFNMVPCFPMDGGRVFRAVAAMFTNYHKATWLAMRVGQVLAVGIAMAGLYYQHHFAPFIAAFVFVVGTMEFRQVDITERLKDKRVFDAMIRRVRVVSSDITIADVAELMADDSQRDFPVVDADQKFKGMLRRKDIELELQKNEGSQEIKRLVRDDVPVLEDESLSNVLLSLGRDLRSLPVINASRSVTGLLDPSTAMTRVGIRSKLKPSPAPSGSEPESIEMDA